jgi:hypothetical protein
LAPAVPANTPPDDFATDNADDRRQDITLHVFVLTPAAEVRNGYLHGYRDRQLPGEPRWTLSIYRRPVSSVTKELGDKRRTTLEQLSARKIGRRYQVRGRQERLLLKLETSYSTSTTTSASDRNTHVMSAFGRRTQQGGGDVSPASTSGGAADIFIDPHDKNRMEISTAAHRRHRRRVPLRPDRGHARGEAVPAPGGMGYYPATSAHPRRSSRVEFEVKRVGRDERAKGWPPSCRSWLRRS